MRPATRRRIRARLAVLIAGAEARELAAMRQMVLAGEAGDVELVAVMETARVEAVESAAAMRAFDRHLAAGEAGDAAADAGHSC